MAWEKVTLWKIEKIVDRVDAGVEYSEYFLSLPYFNCFKCFIIKEF